MRDRERVSDVYFCPCKPSPALFVLNFRKMSALFFGCVVFEVYVAYTNCTRVFNFISDIIFSRTSLICGCELFVAFGSIPRMGKKFGRKCKKKINITERLSAKSPNTNTKNIDAKLQTQIRRARALNYVLRI